MVLADILKRWHVLKQRPAQLLTGTDEHGIKVQKAAYEAEVETYAFCTQHAREFESLAKTANISHDRFFRTTDSDHKEAVSHFWRELKRKGYIYEAKHEGWYCISDETFYPESQVHLVLEPSTGDKIMASMETGKEVFWTSEVNYHFRLSAFRDRLLEHYKENPTFIVPRQRMNHVIKEVESTLSDLSISRPRDRLSWGIPVPDDPGQTVYVWFDALINYITHTGYPSSSAKDTGLWPADVQVIGKDIVRFHTIYWPAFLMALDLPLPKQFLCHAHWTMGTAKMSKSLGNVVDPFSAMNRFGVDAIRYFMARNGGVAHDTPYENSLIVKRYKSELQGQIGGLLNRVVRGKLWNIPQIVTECKEELKLPIDDQTIDAVDSIRMRDKLADAVQDSHEAMEALDIRKVLDIICEVVRDSNAMLGQSEPWLLAKIGTKETQSQLRWIIFEAAETLRIALILLQPIMPGKMAAALDMLGVPAENRFWTAQLATEVPDYGLPMVDIGPQLAHKKAAAATLFPPLLSET